MFNMKYDVTFYDVFINFNRMMMGLYGLNILNKIDNNNNKERTGYATPASFTTMCVRRAHESNDCVKKKSGK